MATINIMPTTNNQRNNTELKYKIKFEGTVKEGAKDVTNEIQMFVSKCANDIIKEADLEDILVDGRIEDEKIEMFLLRDILKRLKEKFRNRGLDWSQNWNLKGSYCTLKTRYCVTKRLFVPVFNENAS